jgi:hypothetical protein
MMKELDRPMNIEFVGIIDYVLYQGVQDAYSLNQLLVPAFIECKASFHLNLKL